MPPLFSPRFEAAVILAARAHQSQTRKGSLIPYISHPVHVSTLLCLLGGDEDLQIAGLLHDVVEDAGISLAEIEAAFGPRVRDIVAALTEEKRDAHGLIPWELRKQRSLEQLAGGDDAVALVKAVDVFHNAVTLLADTHHNGRALIEERFGRRLEQVCGYYRAVFTFLEGRRLPPRLMAELDAVLTDLEALTR